MIFHNFRSSDFFYHCLKISVVETFHLWISYLCHDCDKYLEESTEGNGVYALIPSLKGYMHHGIEGMEAGKFLLYDDKSRFLTFERLV